MRFVTVIRGRNWLAGLCVLLLCAALATAVAVPIAASKAYTPQAEYCVVIDAGHGGIDGGVTGGDTGTPEAELNLDISKRLAQSFESAGIRAVLTRTSGSGLYGIATSGLKRKDMKARAEIIAKAKPDLVISVHQNAFPLRGQRGAQVFFRKGSETSERYAVNVQAQLREHLPASDRVPQIGDYFILNCTDVPAILVECGFLSNPSDERLLLDEAYRDTVAHHIFLGVMRGFCA